MLGRTARTVSRIPNVGQQLPAVSSVLASVGSSHSLPDSATVSHQRQGLRSFHATQKQEVLPLLAVGAVFVIGRYSWKALNRMDEEWEDYQWQLQEYERQKRQQEDSEQDSLTIGVDLGTMYMKLATMNGSRPEIVPTNQGDRYRFSGVLQSDDESITTGRKALEKFYYTPDLEPNENEDVLLPYREMRKESHDDHTIDVLQKVVSASVKEASEQMASAGVTQQEIRTVLTLPTLYFMQHKENLFDKDYHKDSKQTVIVPDPVSAVWGAQNKGLLPTPTTKEELASTSTLVIDVGGLATSISLVKQDKVLATSFLDNVGGETFVQQVFQRVLHETGDLSLGQDPMTLAMMHTSARSAALELVQKTQANVHIPFLFMGRKSDDPHFDMTLSRTALNQAVQSYWTESVVPYLMEKNQLSASMPPPTSAAHIITSSVTKVLEDSDVLPTDISHILLVGGGAKNTMFEQACQEGIWALMGPSPEKLVVPEPSLRAELTSMGAASLLPNYDYNYDRGLERV
eukprot:Nitzschia sp. Nitz4//scaffold169_size48518//33110//34657//NITZ4_007077-RA/size48518-processed-gene-0.81-mRNA-1//1//CDS//3329538403//7241//frame0